MPDKKKRPLKLNYFLIFFIGFGYLASTLAWTIYNAHVPLILNQRFLLNHTMIGAIMTIDNLFGVIFQPLVGARSDQTRTRMGRRMPWIIVGLPLCALFFSLIPLQAYLWSFMIIIIAFNLMMSLWRSPIVALMPDITPSPLRSEANSLINIMGGIGSLIAFYLGGHLSDLREDKFYAFFMASLVMILALILLLYFVKEGDALKYREEKSIPIRDSLPNRWAQEARLLIQENPALADQRQEGTNEEKKYNLADFRHLPAAYKISLTALLIAIFAWFLGIGAIETFFTLYASSSFDLTGGEASMMMTAFSLSFLVSAWPAARLARKIGRKRAILIGLIGLILNFLPVLGTPGQTTVQIFLLIGGIFWSFIIVNSLPMVLEFADENSIGAFTGYYYIFSFSASIVSPILYGYLQDLISSYTLLFPFSFVCFLTALICMIFVKHGESSEMREKKVVDKK